MTLYAIDQTNDPDDVLCSVTEKLQAGVNKHDCFVTQWVGNGSEHFLQVVPK